MTFTLLYDNLNVTQRMEFFNNCIRVGLYATFNVSFNLIISLSIETNEKGRSPSSDHSLNYLFKRFEFNREFINSKNYLTSEKICFLFFVLILRSCSTFFFKCPTNHFFIFISFQGFESLIELPKNLTLNETHMMLSTYLECRKRSYFKQVRVTIKIGDPMINSDTFLDVFNNEIYLKDIYDIITKKFHITKGITILNEKNLTIEFI